MMIYKVLLLHIAHIDGLVQERRNSSALAMELCLSYTKPSISYWHIVAKSLCMTK